MRRLKRVGIAILLLPVSLFLLWGLYEGVGICANHIATGKQTDALQTNLKAEISDVEIISVRSQTGNLSGTGNHVECLSSVTFSTGLQKSEIEDCLAEYYTFDGFSCTLRETAGGEYTIDLLKSAPFADNIEGH